MTTPARNDSFAWILAILRDIALIAFCIVFIIDTL
jgi:hypothetical protein